MENKSHVVSKMVALLLLVMMLAGCATTQYGIQITNVQPSRLYIRNAGTTVWGSNIVGNMQNIDRSLFSEMVDIRVVDAAGTVFTRQNVPFNDAAFVQTEVTRSMNIWGWVGIGAVGLGALIAISALAGDE